MAGRSFSKKLVMTFFIFFVCGTHVIRRDVFTCKSPQKKKESLKFVQKFLCESLKDLFSIELS